jgi:hypothetical protein
MSFYQDVKTVMTGDSSINAIADGIYAKRNLAEIREGEDTLIVYDYSKVGIESSVDNPEYLSYWRIYVYVGSPNAADVFSISDRLSEYLNSYRSDSILNIQFTSDNQSYDSDNAVYYNDLEFTAIYQS